MSASQDPPSPREQALVRRAMPVVERVAAQVSREFHGRVKPRELYALGTFGLYRAARTYRDEMNHDFADYAYRRVRDAMLASVRAELFQERVRRAAIRSADRFCAHHRDDSWNPAEHDEADARRGMRKFLDDVLAAAFAGAIEEAQRVYEAAPGEVDADYRRAIDALAAALRALSDEELRLLSLVYREEMTLDDAAGVLAVSYATARRHHAAALAALRRKLKELGVEHAPPLPPQPRAAELLGPGDDPRPPTT